jgi:hypothetical protein
MNVYVVITAGFGTMITCCEGFYLYGIILTVAIALLLKEA